VAPHILVGCELVTASEANRRASFPEVGVKQVGAKLPAGNPLLSDQARPFASTRHMMMIVVGAR
jgi:hypothetical protein